MTTDAAPSPARRAILSPISYGIRGVRTRLGALRHRLRTLRALRAVRSFRPAQGQEHGLSSPLILSLTSYPPRFATLALTIKSLLMQKVKPDRIILWIAPDDMPFLTDDVLALREFGLEVRPAEDIRSYKKIIPALLAFPDATIVTADDDLYYEPDWLRTLIDGARRTPGSIICRRAHRLKWRGDTLLPYIEWQHDVVTGGAVEKTIFPTGCGGVLYPPGSLAPETCDSETFLKLCPTADDVWLFAMALKAGTGFAQSGRAFAQIAWDGSQETTLMQSNLADRGNDRQLAATLAYFGMEDRLTAPHS